MKKIVLIIPSYNEEAVLHQLYIRLDAVAKNVKKYTFEFLFINDGSTDKTMGIIKELANSDTRVSYVNLSRNYGKEIAMLAGMDYAKGDAAIVIDADLQDPPELIPEMIKYWEEGYDDVYAKRRSRAGESSLKKSTSKLYYKVLQRSTDITIQQDTGDFRLLDKKCIESLIKMRESQRYTKGMFSWVGFNKKEILFDRDPRAAGNTKWSYFKLIELAIEGITSFTVAPLRLSTYVGVAVSFLSFLYIIFILLKTFLHGTDVAGYPSIMAAILFMGGVQLLSIGIIGEYVGRIFKETKQRPLYFTQEVHSSATSKK